MPQITINLCGNNKRHACRKHTKKGSCKRKRKASRKKHKSCKTIYLKIKISCSRHRNPSISIKPVVNRYFFVAPHDIILTEENIIYSNQFVNDRGEPVDEFTDFGQEGYYNLYVNGVMQEGGMYHVKRHEVTLAATGQTISIRTPIIVESVGFTAKLA